MIALGEGRPDAAQMLLEKGLDTAEGDPDPGYTPSVIPLWLESNIGAPGLIPLQNRS